MKRKRLLFAATAMVMASSLWAQVMVETDLTKDFESLATTQWQGSSGQVGWAAPKVTTNSGLNVAAWERYNGSCDWTGDIMNTTVTGLVKGTYKIELYGAAAFTFGRGFGSEAFTGDFSVDTSTTYKENQSITENTGVTLYAETSAGIVSLEIPIWYATNFNTSGLSTVELNGVEVGDDGKIKIGLSKTSRSTNWHVVQLKGVTAVIDIFAAYTKSLNNALAVDQNAKMSASALSQLQTALSTYGALEAGTATAEECEAAIEALDAATSKAKVSIASYAIIEAGSIPDNSLDGWVCTNSNTFHINTWSVEGNPGNDPSGMVTPFIENWVAKGSFLGAGEIYYLLEGLEPGEVYYAQALVRVYNEANADAPNGPTFFINNTDGANLATDGTAFTYNGMSGSFATLGGAAAVAEDGTLKLGVRINEDRNYNWIAFKSVSIQSMDKALESAVAAAEAVTPLNEATQATLNGVLTEYNKTWSTAEEYETAIQAIEAATAAAQPFVEPYSAWLSAKSTAETEYSDIDFITNIISELSADVEAATNVETITNATAELNYAITAYNAYAVEKVIAEKIGVEVTEEPTTAAEAAAAVNDLKVAEFNFVNEQYPYDYAPVIGEFGTWTGTATVAGQPATPNYLNSEHWSGETHAYYEQAANGWGNANGWTIQYEKKAKLPAGDYMLKVAARSSAGTTSLVSCSATDFTVSLPTAGNATKGIDTTGASNFGEGNFANNGNGFGWEWRFLPFTLAEETEVTMTFYAEATTQHQWMSISDGTLLSKQEIVNPISIASTDDAAPEATVASEVTTDRKLLSGLNTIVLPFETTATEIGATTVLEYTGTTTSDAGNIVFNFKEVAPVDNVVTLQANVPYAVFVDADQTETLAFGKKNIAPAEDLTTEDGNGQFDFVGTYTNLAKGNSVIVAGDYIAGETAFKKVANGGNRVAAYRAYLKKVGSSEVVSEVAFNFGDTFVDGIEAVEILNKLSGNIYNLNGQKLNNVQKGINIVNGKKLLVK